REPVAEVGYAAWVPAGETRTHVEEESSIRPDSWRCGAASGQRVPAPPPPPAAPPPAPAAAPPWRDPVGPTPVPVSPPAAPPVTAPPPVPPVAAAWTGPAAVPHCCAPEYAESRALYSASMVAAEAR